MFVSRRRLPSIGPLVRYFHCLPCSETQPLQGGRAVDLPQLRRPRKLQVRRKPLKQDLSSHQEATNPRCSVRLPSERSSSLHGASEGESPVPIVRSLLRTHRHRRVRK